MVITKELLKKNGFYCMSDTNQNEYYRKQDKVNIEFQTGLSNIPDREWFCVVENDSFEVIGGCDIDTTEQLEYFLKALDKDIKDVFDI